MRDRFEWCFNVDGIRDLLHPSWRMWVRFRLREATLLNSRGGSYDFVSVGLYLNAPQAGDKRLFTGVTVALFKRELCIGRWHPLSYYNLRPLPQRRSA